MFYLFDLNIFLLFIVKAIECGFDFYALTIKFDLKSTEYDSYIRFLRV